MKVLQLTASSGSGGLEKHVVELTNGLHSAGLDVVFAGPNDLIERIASDVPCFSITSDRSRFSLALHREIFQLVNRVRPDIVHVHGVKAGSVLVRISKFIGSTKSIITIHNSRKSSKRIASKFDGVICVSDKILETVTNNNRWRIYNGIKSFQFEESPRGDHFLAVGRLVHDKGFDVLIKAAAQTKTTLKIAGDGSEKKSLVALVNELGAQSRIEFLGPVTNVHHLMTRCRGVVISSRNEGFSYVFAEALASGTPVISTDVPVANEVLPKRMLCPVDDPDALAGLLEQFNPKDYEYTELYRFAKGYFSLDAMISSTSNVYKKLLGLPFEGLN